jgi:OOP family OmpA-OmpF porin
MPEPQQSADQAAPVAEEQPLTHQPFVDEEEAPKDGDAVAQQQFTDEAAPAMDEDVVAEQFTDDAAPPKEDDVVAEQLTDDAAPSKEDDVVAQQQFSDESPAAKEDDVVAQQQFSDESPAAKDEDIVAQQHFSDDAAATPEEVTAPEVYKEDVAEAAPEELAREPETFSEEKVAQAEEPKAPPVTMLPVTVTVEAEPLFDFDRYSIRADARSKLDDLIQQLKAVNYGDIIAVGFADPIGTAKYNQGLSERRAASVKRYLVSKGIPADRIKTEGRGRTEEYASLKKCSGLHKQKLIACLQPDRRVEVTVTAERQQ